MMTAGRAELKDKLVFMGLQLLLLTAAWTAAPSPALAAMPKESLPSCGKPITGLVDLVRPGRITLFGEIHGTREIPEFVGDMLCREALAGAVHLAIEVPHSEQARIDAYLASTGGPENRAELLRGPFWLREFQDGRSSAAMADLIERARMLRAAGRMVRVTAMDIAEPFGNSDRDAEMAKRILEAYSAAPHERFIVLAGNVHTRMVRGAPWNPAFEPMGLHLVTAGREVVSLDAGFQTGTAWVCLSANAAECGTKALLGDEGVSTRTITFFTTPTPEGFSGRFFVGPVSASAPAHSVFAGHPSMPSGL